MREPRIASRVAVLTGGGDRPYALGLASALVSLEIPFDFIASDELDSPELHQNSLVRFLNLRGKQNQVSPFFKVLRVSKYYLRLLSYAITSEAPIFHILWNNKIEFIDRTALTFYYKLLGKRLVLTAHNVNKQKRDGNDTWLNRFTLSLQYRMMDHIFVHTEQMKRELQNDFRVTDEKISVIPFGINSSVPETDLNSAAARLLLGLESGEKILLFFGNIAPYKGLEYLVKALRQLTASGGVYRLIIAGRPKGSESYWADIHREIEEAGLSGSVIEKIEYISDADTEIYFKAADVFVLPYTHIFQSGVLFLGYNFGLPVISTDVGSLREDIVDGKTGFVCKPKDSVSLAACIEAYFCSDLYRNLGARRHEICEYARDRYSWARVASLTEEVYESVTADISGIH
jgi:glycosyltransferase involved in cell wall biosynthesis